MVVPVGLSFWVCRYVVSIATSLSFLPIFDRPVQATWALRSRGVGICCRNFKRRSALRCGVLAKVCWHGPLMAATTGPHDAAPWNRPKPWARGHRTQIPSGAAPYRNFSLHVEAEQLRIRWATSSWSAHGQISVETRSRRNTANSWHALRPDRYASPSWAAHDGTSRSPRSHGS